MQDTEMGLENRSGTALDNPAIPLSQALALGWTQQSSSGIAVTRDSVLAIPACNRAISLISGHIARLAIEGYKIGANNSRRIVDDHPAYYLLHQRPSPLYSPTDWKSACAVDVLLHGNSYNWVVRDSFGTPQEIIRLDPQSVQPEIAGNRLVYKVKLNSGGEKYLVDSDVLHFKGACGNGIVGFSILDKMLDALGLASALQKFSAVYFSNNCTPGLMLEYTTAPTTGKEGKDQLKANLERLHMGLEKSHRLAVLPWGVKVASGQLDAEKAQLLDSRKFSLIDIANAIGLSPNRLGANVTTSYSSLEAEKRAFLEDLEIYLVGWEEEINYKLLTESEKRIGKTYFQFDRSSMEKPDSQTQETIWIGRVNNGLVSLNTYLANTNQPTIPEPWADLHRMPAQIIYAEQAAEPKPDPQPPTTEPTDDGVENPSPETTAPPAADDAADAEVDAGTNEATDRYRTLIAVDVDRQINRIRKASEGKSAEWFAGEDFLHHRQIFASSIPFAEAEIDDFLGNVINTQRIDDDAVAALKEAICKS